MSDASLDASGPVAECVAVHVLQRVCCSVFVAVCALQCVCCSVRCNVCCKVSRMCDAHLIASDLIAVCALQCVL